MPEPSQRGFIAPLPASHPLKSPITETERALGAHTAKEALAILGQMGAEILEEPGVAAFLEQIDVVFGQSAHACRV